MIVQKTSNLCLPLQEFLCAAFLFIPIACGKYGATKRERAVQTNIRGGGGREAEAHLEAQTIRVKGGKASNLVLRRRHGHSPPQQNKR